MSTFIERVVQTLIQHNMDWSRTRIILPGKRPALQFRKAFDEQNHVGILPEFLSLQQFVERISGHRLLPSYTLCLEAYADYTSIQKEPDDFERFLQWFPTLLKDFDDIDAQLGKSEQLFSYLASVERIEQWGKSEMIENQLLFWTMAKELYVRFNKRLATANQAYAGANSRRAVEQMKTFFEKDDFTYVICGFNALTAAEIQLFSYLDKQDKAQFFWHADAYYFENPWQEAGDFLRENAKWAKVDNFVDTQFIQPKKIVKIGATQKVAQAKSVSTLLESLSAEELQKTGLVLGDEQLLPLILDALPNNVEQANVTMGFPIHAFPQIHGWKLLVDFHDPNKRSPEPRQLAESNWFDPKVHRYPEHEKTGTGLFARFEHISYFLDAAIDALDDFFEKQKKDVLSANLILRLRTIFMQLKGAAKEFPFFSDFTSLNIIFNQLIRSETLDFIGEPLLGLQISGMLETRLLEYPRVILTSVNEGVLPLGKRENSFISYGIRKQFGMYTYSENDAVYAYHFYRLIQSAEEVYLVYDVSDAGMGAGEQSRFITQMEYESPHQIRNQTAQLTQATGTSHQREIRRTPKLTEALEAAFIEKRISPSSLKSYIYNPYRFIAEKLLRIAFTQDFALQSLLGNLVHNTLEQVYMPYVGKQIAVSDIAICKQRLPNVFSKVFADEMASAMQISTEQNLIQQVALDFIRRQLDWDEKLAEKHNWILYALEFEATTTLSLANGKQATLYGKIDRVDEVDGVRVLVDYKTGSDKMNKTLVFDKFPTAIRRKDQGSLLQLACYAIMYSDMFPKVDIACCLFALKTAEVKRLSPKGEESLSADFLALFRKEITALLEEIVYEQEVFAEKYEEEE